MLWLDLRRNDRDTLTHRLRLFNAELEARKA